MFRPSVVRSFARLGGCDYCEAVDAGTSIPIAQVARHLRIGEKSPMIRALFMLEVGIRGSTKLTRRYGNVNAGMAVLEEMNNRLQQRGRYDGSATLATTPRA